MGVVLDRKWLYSKVSDLREGYQAVLESYGRGDNYDLVQALRDVVNTSRAMLRACDKWNPWDD